MKNILGFLLLFLFPILLQAQDSLVLYQTFEDYQQNKGELKTGDFIYRGVTSPFRKRYITLIDKTPDIPKDQKKIKIYPKGMWGFKLNNALFRIKDKSDVPYCLLSTGKFFYYENGLVHIKILLSRKPINEAHIVDTWGGVAYFSTEINSKLILLPGFGQIGGSRSNNKLIHKYPALKEFFTCAKGYRYPKLRNCVEKFNGEKLPDREVY